MNKVWVVARHEYLTGLRRAGFILMTVIVPLLGAIALLVAAFFGGQAAEFLRTQFGNEPKRIGIVDQSGYFSPLLPDYISLAISYLDEQKAQEALLAGEIDVYLVIPADYLTTGKVRAVSTGSGFGVAALSDSKRLRQFFVDHLLAGQVDPALRQRVARPMDLIPITLNAQGERRGGDVISFVFSFVVPYMLAILLVITIFVSSGYLLQGVSEEKESRIIEIILSSVSAKQLLAGKVLGLGALGLTQVLIWLFSGWGLSGGAVTLLALAGPAFISPKVVVLGLVYYLLGYLLYAVLMGTAGSLGTSMRESQQLAGIFSMMAAVPYMISGFIFTNPNMTIARVLSYIPFTAPTMMMLRLPLATDVPPIDIVISLVGLVISIPFVLWAGAKVFRMGLLMYGKRPAVAEIIRALREA